ncbi:uncharacterized protein C16orf74 homolog isoform X1 [Ovis aries]|uniref:uncharacterized protein C16orf74 homolog isoform X1 n=1 Tax=Ovis aries TaxID=9940 RepID=UPI001C2E9D28|nr:uncharacterized protein C16orf74 homolog isoform X1 [Ovis aries]
MGLCPWHQPQQVVVYGIISSIASAGSWSGWTSRGRARRMETLTLRPETAAQVGFACPGSCSGRPPLRVSRALGCSAEDAGWEDAAIPALDQRRGERSEQSAPPASRATLPRPRGVDRTSTPPRSHRPRAW